MDPPSTFSYRPREAWYRTLGGSDFSRMLVIPLTPPRHPSFLFVQDILVEVLRLVSLLNLTHIKCLWAPPLVTQNGESIVASSVSIIQRWRTATYYITIPNVTRPTLDACQFGMFVQCWSDSVDGTSLIILVSENISVAHAVLTNRALLEGWSYLSSDCMGKFFRVGR